jgi:uncharacterized protein with HEPN domain
VKGDQLYLRHILDCIGFVEEYTKAGKLSFMKSRLIQDAVIRNFEVIGEAAKRISPQLKARTDDIPWKQITGFRDILIHDYLGVDVERVWNVIGGNLPALKQKVTMLLSEIERP